MIETGPGLVKTESHCQLSNGRWYFQCSHSYCGTTTPRLLDGFAAASQEQIVDNLGQFPERLDALKPILKQAPMKERTFRFCSTTATILMRPSSSPFFLGMRPSRNGVTSLHRQLKFCASIPSVAMCDPSSSPCFKSG